MVYISASGASDAMLAQAFNTHNLANAATPGFRADLVAAQTAVANDLEVESRAYARSGNTGIDVGQGVVNFTGRDLDVAVNGEGWFTILDEEGVEAYSRRGDLRVDQLGQLRDGAGRQIAGNAGAIAVPPYSEINIGSDGTISIVPMGESATTLAVIDRIKLVNPPADQLQKDEQGLIRLPEGEVAAADARVTVIGNSLESSNVDSVAAMVRMIELSRQFEHHTKMMKVAEQLDRSTTELMSMS
jgi:flagellar basal-body rod protein FlgF